MAGEADAASADSLDMAKLGRNWVVCGPLGLHLRLAGRTAIAGRVAVGWLGDRRMGCSASVDVLSARQHSRGGWSLRRDGSWSSRLGCRRPDQRLQIRFWCWPE